MRCRADRLILRPRCPGQRDAGLGTTPGAEGDGGAKAGVALSGLRRPGPQSPRSVEFRVEIGPVPCRDRFSSAPRSVRRRRARGPGPRGGHFGARWAFRCESDGGVVGLAPKCRPRRERGRAPAGVVPHERRTAPRRAQPAPRGRTRRRTVVPRSTRSYPGSRGRTLKPPLQYDPAPQRTTTRIHVRPREPGYDRPEVMAAGPVGRTTTRATAPPHDPPTAPDPSPPHPDHGHPPRPQAAQHVRPPTTTGLVTNRLTAQPRQPNRTRAGTRPNSSRN